MLRNHKAVAALAGLVLAVVAAAYWAGRDQPAPPPPSEPNAAQAELAGVHVTAWVLDEADTARRAFGADIRGAGLLPVRLALDNRGAGAVRLEPARIFLIDGQGLAWPLLTADQARDRLAETLGADGLPKNTPSARQWIDAAPVLTGFALDMFVEKAPAAAAGGSGWLERLLGSGREAPEPRGRRHLLSKFLSNPPVPAGASAVGYLFFPGREEVRGAESLRLALGRDGRVEVARIPLAPAWPSGDQSRPIAR